VQHARGCIESRVDEALAEYRSALQSSLEKVSADWQSEQESLDERFSAAESEISTLREELVEAKGRVRGLKKRTALTRFARASTTWLQLCAVRHLKEKARRTKATNLRKLRRELVEVENEMVQKQEAINSQVRKEEIADEKARDERKAVLQNMQKELFLFRDRINAAEERKRQIDTLEEVVRSVPTSEADLVQRWAEVMSCPGSTGFSNRLQVHSNIPGLGGDDDGIVAGADQRRRRRAAPVQSKQRLEGGLLQVEEQIRGVHLPALGRSSSVPVFNASEAKMRFHASGQSL
jgi:hypothetical protein